MTKYIDADKLKAKLDEHYRKYQSKYMETRTPYTQGLIDALDLVEQVIDSLPDESINPFDTKLFQDGVKEGLRLAKESGGELTGPELIITPLTTLGEVKSFVAASILNKKTKKIIILEDNG